MRAIRARYDPYEQTRGRVEQLKSLGHNVDKVSLLLYRMLVNLHGIVGRVHYHGWHIYEYARGLQK
jgi:hypothetical protein